MSNTHLADMKTNGFESNVRFDGLCTIGKSEAGGNLPKPPNLG
jgi:hypothetical protein